MRAVVERGLKGVVAGVGDGALQLDTAEWITAIGLLESRARGLLVEWPARRRTKAPVLAQTHRGIGGVGFFKHQ